MLARVAGGGVADLQGAARGVVGHGDGGRPVAVGDARDLIPQVAGISRRDPARPLPRGQSACTVVVGIHVRAVVAGLAQEPPGEVVAPAAHRGARIRERGKLAAPGVGEGPAVILLVPLGHEPLGGFLCGADTVALVDVDANVVHDVFSFRFGFP